MNDFMYYNPVRVHFGADAMSHLPEELGKFGANVLLTYGGGSETYGVVDSLAVTSALYPEIMTKLVAAKCRIELHDAEKRGYFHFDTAAPEAEHNAVLCTAVDTALFKQRMYALLGAK